MPPEDPDRPAVAARPRLLPSALERRGEIAARLAGRRPVLFLDYDGTLTPIVERPEDAVLAESTGRVLARLAERLPIAVVSGRGRPDVEERLGLEGIYYAGSHGFDIAGPASEVTYEAAEHLVPVVAEVTRRLEAELAGIGGAQVEAKRFTVAVHYRRVAPADVPRMEVVVDRLVAGHPELRKAGGKKVWEIRPALDWDKGRAVEWILRVMVDGLRLDAAALLPIYIGDDETDEDAFRALARRDPSGIGVLVTAEPVSTAASYTLRDPDEVRELLEWLAAQEEDRSPSPSH